VFLHIITQVVRYTILHNLHLAAKEGKAKRKNSVLLLLELF
jgi:hypothetical protein